MSNIETALEIALNAYRGKLDKAGQSYIYHPLRVMHSVVSESEKIVALLHDVIEDSDISAKDLERHGFSSEIIDAVIALTKNKNEDYHQFVVRAKENPIARTVKIADIEDNINVLRLDKLTEKDLSRVERYHKAWHFLKL